MQQGDNRTRRSFLKGGAGALGAAMFGPGAGPRPNFIFMTTDGHRPDALSLNGNSILRTPNFDRIRATVLTGLYSHSTGCIDNKDREIPKEVPLFTDLLQQAGYEVSLFGKAQGHAALTNELRQRLAALRKATDDHYA